MSFLVVQIQKITLNATISSTADTITFDSLKLIDGTNVTMSMFGSIGYITLEPGTSKAEQISFTGITQNGNGTATITGVVRGISPNSPYSSSSTFKFSHAGGAVAVVSNTSAFYSQFSVIQNDETITGIKTFSALPSITAGNPINDNDIARKGYVDSVVAGSYPANRLIVSGNAGETVALGELIYLDTTDDEWKLCDADTATTVENVLLGIALGAGTDGNVISNGVLLRGYDNNQTGLTAGSVYYASNTAGAISSTPGTKEVTIGFSLSTTEIYFSPRFNQYITEDQQDALEGTDGTPSASNKYVTASDVAENTNSKAVRRKSDGNVTVPSTPTAATDAASKNYVDTAGVAGVYAPNSQNGATYETYILKSLDLGWSKTTCAITYPWGTNILADFEASGAASGAVQQLPNADNTSGFSTPYTLITDKEVRIKAKMAFDGSAGRLAFGVAESAANLSAAVSSTTPRAAFVVDNGVIYAVSGDGTNNDNTDVDSGITDGNFNTYQIVINPGTDVKFYINETLVATHTDEPQNGSGVYIGYAMSASGGNIRGTDIMVSVEK